MAHPLVFVVGVPHSGTTWCAALLAACGYDLGSDLHHADSGISPWHGKEWRPAFDLLGDASGALGMVGARDRPDWWVHDESQVKRVRWNYGDRIMTLQWPPLVKYPGSGAPHFWDLIQPGFVVIMVRDPVEWAHSMSLEPYMRIPFDQRVDQYQAACQDIIHRTQNRPHTVMEFESAAADAEEAWRCLSGVPGLRRETLSRAHREVTVPAWVGQSRRCVQSR